MADLANIKKNIKDTVVVELEIEGSVICHDDGKPMTITLNGPHSKAAAEVNFDMQDEAIKTFKEKGEQELDSRKMDAIRKDRLARQTCGWDITVDGKKPKLSYKEVLAFYNDYPVFFNQVEGAYERESGFTLA